MFKLLHTRHVPVMTDRSIRHLENANMTMWQKSNGQPDESWNEQGLRNTATTVNPRFI
jgi:hypothetical protein